MKVSAFNGKRGNRNGALSRPNGPINGLNNNERERIKELQHIWLSVALQIIARSTRRSDARVIGITSAGAREGKTTNCMGLAAALARETDLKVSVVECDLVSASMASELGLEPTLGLSDYLRGGAGIEDIVTRTRVPNLDLVLAGRVSDSTGLLEEWSHPDLSRLKRGFPELVNLFRQLYGFVMLDLPPMLTNPYGKEMVTYTDETFLTAMAGLTSMDTLAQASRQVNEDKLAGVLLAGADSQLPEWITKMLTEGND